LFSTSGTQPARTVHIPVSAHHEGSLRNPGRQITRALSLSGLFIIAEFISIVWWLALYSLWCLQYEIRTVLKVPVCVRGCVGESCSVLAFMFLLDLRL